jgi:hypothetical protein
MKAQRSGESGVWLLARLVGAGSRQQSLTPVTLQSRIVINNVVSACVQSVQSVQIVARQQAGRGEGEGERCCVLCVVCCVLCVGLVVGCCVGWARNSRSPQAWCGALLAQA